MFIVAALESNQGLPFSLSLCLKQCELEIGSARMKSWDLHSNHREALGPLDFMTSMVRMQVLSAFEFECGFRWLFRIGPCLVNADEIFPQGR